MTDRYTRRIYLALAEGRDLTSDEETHLAGCAACGAAAERARDFEWALHRDLAEPAVPLPADPGGLPADRPNRTAPALVAVGAAVLVIAVGGGAALVATPEQSPTPMPTPTPAAVAVTAEPSASPTAAPTPRFGPSVAPLVAGTYAHLAVPELSFHDRPGGDPFTDINPGSDVWVIEVVEDWYLVQAQEAMSAEHIFGFVPIAEPAQGGEGEAAFMPTLTEFPDPDCQLDLHAFYVLSLHPQRQLECLGDQPVAIEGYAIERGAERSSPYAGEPAWLAEWPSLEVSSAIGPAVTGISVPIHVPPDLEIDIPTSDREAHEGTLLRVTGHLDDPASTECQRTPIAAPYPAVDDELSELWCRQRFVVDSVEIVDPGS
jgi:hypothetical protein